MALPRIAALRHGVESICIAALPRVIASRWRCLAALNQVESRRCLESRLCRAALNRGVASSRCIAVALPRIAVVLPRIAVALPRIAVVLPRIVVALPRIAVLPSGVEPS